MNQHLAKLIALVKALSYDIDEDDRIIIEQELTDVFCRLPDELTSSKEVQTEFAWVMEELLGIQSDPDYCYRKSAEMAHALPTS